MWNWICSLARLFSNRESELTKIASMREQQANLEQRRDSLYQEIASLNQRDVTLVEMGKQQPTVDQQRIVASQIFHIRQDKKRVNAITGLVNKRITILATDIHNLAIVSEARALGLKLPSPETLVDNATAAEQAMEDISASADLCHTLIDEQAQALESAATYGQFDDIMREFQSDQSTDEVAAAIVDSDDDVSDTEFEKRTKRAFAEQDRIAMGITQ